MTDCGKQHVVLREVTSPCRLEEGHEGDCSVRSVKVTWGPDLRVVAAAVRIGFEGHLVHNEARELVLSVPAPGRHHNVMYLASRMGIDLNGSEEQGFLLSDGTFADRRRALEVATEAKQIIRRCGGDTCALSSENLW